MTVACVSETSGNASMGSRRNAVTPRPTNSTAMSATNSGCRRAKATTRWIIGGARPDSVEQLLQQDAALRHHALARVHARRDQHTVVVFVVDVDLAADERARL